MFIQSVVILALVTAIVLKKREYGWLKYDEELDSMLSQSTLFVRRKTLFGLLSINAVKDLPWLIDKKKLKKVDGGKQWLNSIEKQFLESLLDLLLEFLLAGVSVLVLTWISAANQLE